MFADVVGFSTLMGVNEEATLAVVNELIREFKDHIGEFRGEILNVSGDGVLAFFESVLAAVKFAVSIQAIINDRGMIGPDGQHVQVRIASTSAM